MSDLLGTSTVSSSSGSVTGSSGSTVKNTVLKTEDFLKLMVAQLQYQNPMSPTDPNQFMGELAQFSMLQQLADLQSVTQKMAGEQQIGTAINLIGKEVKVQKDDGTTQEETVTGVQLENGVPFLMLGQTKVSLDTIIEVNEASSTSEDG